MNLLSNLSEMVKKLEADRAASAIAAGEAPRGVTRAAAVPLPGKDEAKAVLTQATGRRARARKIVSVRASIEATKATIRTTPEELGRIRRKRKGMSRWQNMKNRTIQFQRPRPDGMGAAVESLQLLIDPRSPEDKGGRFAAVLTDELASQRRYIVERAKAELEKTKAEPAPWKILKLVTEAAYEASSTTVQAWWSALGEMLTKQCRLLKIVESNTIPGLGLG